MNAAPEGYVLATRVFKKGKWRTRYYLGCIDGRPRLGPKALAPRFPYDVAGRICAQLIGFVFFLDTSKPPRAAAWPKFVAQPRQVVIPATDELAP